MLSDALVDFTGGVSEHIDLRGEEYTEDNDKRVQLLEHLLSQLMEHTVICLTIDIELGSDIGQRTDLGLCKGHVYHVTDVKKVYLGETNLRNLFKGREKVAMVRLRDPREEPRIPPGSPQSGGSGEKFAYSTSILTRLRSRNTDWQKVKDSERQRLGLLFRDHTEFWMPLEDVVAEFDEIVMCRLMVENIFSISGRQKWRVTWAEGSWAPNFSGGADPNSETFLNNPQYLVEVRSDTEVILQLMQFHCLEGFDAPTDVHSYLGIGFHIIKVEENRRTRLHRLWSHSPVLVSEGPVKRREVNYRGILAKGRYLTLPCTETPSDKALFLLRLFARQFITLRELTSDYPKALGPCSCLSSEPEWVTVVTVNSAEDLSVPPTWRLSKLNVYCVISCEGVKVKTNVANNGSQPSWHISYVFFRRNPQKPITLQVLNHNSVMPDELIGECEVAAVVTHRCTPLSVSLQARRMKGESEPTVTGTLHLTLLTEDNLLAL